MRGTSERLVRLWLPLPSGRSIIKVSIEWTTRAGGSSGLATAGCARRGATAILSNQREEPGESAGRPDPGDDDELRLEDLPSAGSWRHKPAWGMWRSWETRRQRIGQPYVSRVAGAGITALLALLLVVLATGDGAPYTTLAYAGSRAAVGETAGGWEQVPLPAPPGSQVAGFAPSPVDPATAFACTAGPFGEFRIWRTRDTGAHWTSVALPPSAGAWCQITVATDTPSRVAVLSGIDSDYPPCESNPLFLSDDGGDSWMRVAPPHFGPADAFAVVCQFWPTAHHLYFLSSFQVGSRGEPVGRGPQVSILARSDDNGRSWSRVDPESEGDLVFFTFQIGNEDTLIASTVYWGRSSRSPVVWVSHNAGETWTKLDAANPPFTTTLVTLPIPATSPRPVYAMLDEQLPSFLFRLRASEFDLGARSWTTVPPLPVPGASADRTGLLQVYQETGDGRLLAFGVDPQTGVPAKDVAGSQGWQGIPQQWLWVWDPRVGRWFVWPTPLPVRYLWGCGVCLYSAATRAVGPAGRWRTVMGTYLWINQVDEPPGVGFGKATIAYRVFVPDAPPGDPAPSA